MKTRISTLRILSTCFLLWGDAHQMGIPYTIFWGVVSIIEKASAGA